jgi:hypothetical protein
MQGQHHKEGDRGFRWLFAFWAAIFAIAILALITSGVLW